ncbi:MAG TPA: TonB-dependent receptor plug domain-containing protein [Gemmatimonadaceae bacterium]|nr:TonB-dependent receptor plug domain-containing protein [Gemmatimonadaceae bacterium]
MTALRRFGLVGTRFMLAALAVATPRLASSQADTARASKADSAGARSLNTIKITGRADDLTGIASTASQGHIGFVDIRQRPIAREGELLETVPGLIVTQHSGDGKANQYFIRGFNLDHGTDFQTRIEGMPVNMPSHAHGQGYTDLNFLIPELVDYIDYRLGVYHTELGDFGSAGGAEFRLMRKLDRPFATADAGEHGLARLAMGTSKRLGSGDALFGGELKAYDGPWVLAERVRKVSGVARYSWDRNASRFSVLGMAYRNRWRSSDQIPQRAVDEGSIGRFGYIDGTDGGNTQRYSVSGSWNRVGGKSTQKAQLFGIYSDLSLFSNFTYFLDDPDRGDQFNQRERRTVIGGNVSHAQQVQVLGLDHTVTVGLQTRADFLSPVGLYRTERRKRYATVRQDDVTQLGSGLYVEAQSHWRPWLRTTLGVRGDAYLFDVTSDRTANSGSHTATIASPKASIAFVPTPNTELYISGGLGFHSNDARGTTITVDPVSGHPVQQVDPLVRSRGAEIGLRANPVPGFRSTLALWALELDSELLFIGDGGATEPSDKSRRSGITLANFYRPIPQLSIDADVSLARARFAAVDANADRIPGALENVVAGGMTWSSPLRGPFGAIRVRHFGAYPLIEDNSVRGKATTLLNADGGFLFSDVRVQVSVLNLLNRRANDIQYFYDSRLQGERAAGSGDVHFHPVEPRQVRLSLGWGL